MTDEVKRAEQQRSHTELLKKAEKLFARLRPKFGGDSSKTAVEGNAAWALLTIDEIKEVRAISAELSMFSKLWRAEMVERADAELARRGVKL